jgi:hypothetical protein
VGTINSRSSLEESIGAEPRHSFIAVGKMIPCIAPLVFQTAPTVFPISFSVDDSSRYHHQRKYHRCSSSHSNSSTDGGFSSNSDNYQQRSRCTMRQPAGRRRDDIVVSSRLRSAAWISVVPYPQPPQQQQQQQQTNAEVDDESALDLLLDTLVDHMLCCTSGSFEESNETRHPRRRPPGVRPSHSLDLIE